MSLPVFFTFGLRRLHHILLRLEILNILLVDLLTNLDFFSLAFERPHRDISADPVLCRAGFRSYEFNRGHIAYAL